MNIDTKILLKTLVKRIQQYIKRIFHDQVELLQGFSAGSVFEISITHHFNKLKKKHTIISINAELTFDKFMIKIQKNRNREKRLQLIKSIYKKLTANIVLNQVIVHPFS